MHNNFYLKIKTFSIFGLFKSEIYKKLFFFNKNFFNIKLKIYDNSPQFKIKLYKKTCLMSSNQELHTAIKWIITQIGSRIISNNGDLVENIVIKMLKIKNFTLSIAESCTGGLVTNYLTKESGSSKYFYFSAITYSNKSKINILKIKFETIKKYGSTHKKIAENMAICAKKKGATTYALSTTGITGPTGATSRNPVGTVYIGFASENFSYSQKFNFPFQNRIKNKKFFTITALNMLRKELLLILN